MSKKYRLEFKAESENEVDIVDDLQYVAQQIEKGFVSGYLTDGRWDLFQHEVCDECGGMDGKHQDVAVDDTVDQREPHLRAPVGSAKCPKEKGE